jgi:hypothetical protein
MLPLCINHVILIQHFMHNLLGTLVITNHLGICVILEVIHVLFMFPLRLPRFLGMLGHSPTLFELNQSRRFDGLFLRITLD